MSKIDTLIKNYETCIAIPWREIAAAQRVIFAVYPESDERRLRDKIVELEIATKNHGHGWIHFDLTNTFAEWMGGLKYAKSYYQKPQLLGSIILRYGDYIENKFTDLITQQNAGNEDVVALSGVGSVFGFIKVRDLVGRLAPKVNGRLLVLFPGSYEDNKYSLLNAYDGWDYHALPITCDREI